MHDGNDSSRFSRRRLLKAASVSATVGVVGTTPASASAEEPTRAQFDDDCPETTLEPSHGYCSGASLKGCADDHEVTIELREAVDETLSERYPDAGALLDAGFKPYFDTLNGGDGWSHWLSPEYIGDDSLVDPDRPESVLVDNESWRSIGVMFIATLDGEAVSPPPVVYDEELGVTYEDGVAPIDPEPATEPEGNDDDDQDEDSDDHDADGSHHGPDGPAHRCSPWHYHAGLPGRFAWWYYQTVYEPESDIDTLLHPAVSQSQFSPHRARENRDTGTAGSISLPCRTPCMMHVWTADHPEGVYAHSGPPPEYRNREPTEEAGFETDAEPGEDTLGWEVLPDEHLPDRRPSAFSGIGP